MQNSTVNYFSNKMNLRGRSSAIIWNIWCRVLPAADTPAVHQCGRCAATVSRSPAPVRSAAYRLVSNLPRHFLRFPGWYYARTHGRQPSVLASLCIFQWGGCPPRASRPWLRPWPLTLSTELPLFFPSLAFLYPQRVNSRITRQICTRLPFRDRV